METGEHCPGIGCGGVTVVSFWMRPTICPFLVVSCSFLLMCVISHLTGLVSRLFISGVELCRA